MIHIDTEKCTGCGACAAKCPAACISMAKDTEGFLFPKIDITKCVNCGICDKICPNDFKINCYMPAFSSSYIAIAKDFGLWQKSASGGVFAAAAADIILNKKGVVFGAAFDNELAVKHIGIESIEDLPLLQNSKYVQSDMGKCYKDIREFLKKGRYVLFCGTPCQVAGLYAYLDEKPKKLLTMDLICHGVPSPELLKYYIVKTENAAASKLLAISFREKKKTGKSISTYQMHHKYINGKVKVIPLQNDVYFSLFSKGISLRKSCYSCMYTTKSRVSDITIGDCDSGKLYDFHNDESKSSVLCNSDRGIAYWESIKSLFDSIPLDLEKESQHNSQLNSSMEYPKERDLIYEDLQKLSWNNFVKKYAKEESFLTKIKKTLYAVLPQKFYRTMMTKLSKILK